MPYCTWHYAIPCDLYINILTWEFQWKEQSQKAKQWKSPKSECQWHVMWLQFWKTVSQISIWLAKKTFHVHYSFSRLCLVRQKCGWKGNSFDRRVNTLKCGWHPHDAGELALLRKGPSIKWVRSWWGEWEVIQNAYMGERSVTPHVYLRTCTISFHVFDSFFV